MKELQIEWREVEALIPYARNARTHSDEQVAQIAASMQEFGWTNPVLVDGSNGIIAGHGRILAARKLSHERVPCIELSHLTEAQKRAYVLADNKLAENASWDNELLGLELGDLQGEGFDLDLTGFGDEELKNLLDQEQGTEDPGDGEDYSPALEVAVECDSEEEQESVYNLLTEKGYKCRVLSM